MQIVVPIKQVPETSDVHMDKETGTMIRSGSSAIVNPLDLYALETALLLKDSRNAHISVLTMGPPSAVKALKEALAMGCDEALHLSDRAFSGSDTWATSYTLSQAIRKVNTPDLIITGERATDGDTGQVGPGIASWLDIPLLTYVSSIKEVTDSYIVIERLTEEGYQTVRCKFPAVISVVKEIAEPRLPTLKGKKRAMATTIPLWDAKDIEADPAFLGLKGSPTKVVKIETPTVSRGCKVVHAQDDASLEKSVTSLLDFLEERNLLTGGGHHA